MRATALILAAASLAGVVTAQTSRVDVQFDLGWRFWLGPNTNTSGTTCSLTYPSDLTGVQCSGLVEIAGVSTQNDCMMTACVRDADVWQWCPGGSAGCGGAACWVGPMQACALKNGAGWMGAGKNGTVQPWNPPASQQTYDDSSWRIIDLPFDYELEENYNKSANKGEAYLPYNQAFFRKYFALPAEWNTSYIELELEGVLSTSSVWLNGVQLVNSNPAGYVPTILRLDNATSGAAALVFGGGLNTLVVYADGAETTGWWYEGGLFRSAVIRATSRAARFVSHGLTNPAYVTGPITPNGPSDGSDPAAGLTADAVITPTAEIECGQSNGQNILVLFSLLAADGVTVMATTNATAGLGGNSVKLVRSPPMTISGAQLWSIPRPYLYTLMVTVSTCPVSNSCVGAVQLDNYNATTGIRDIEWNPDLGLYLNQQPVKIRGFCNHESFAGVGGVIPDRVDLLRVQQMRGVGGNGWRTSHNPPEPVLLALSDRLGIAVLDENRVFATMTNCEGCSQVPAYAGNQVQDMIALTRRDRTHSSVIWWSFCNEAGCGNGQSEPAEDFRLATYANDGSRMVGANMGWISPVTPSNMSALLDVMGFSHASTSEITAFHEQEPGKPLAMTECCSCETQRGEDADWKPSWNSTVFYGDENSVCVREQTQTSNAVPWMAATFVWTLHDYYGEPDNFPHISSSFGSYDLSGFPKAPVWWYRSWWLANVSTTDAARPPLPANATSTFVRIVEAWQPPCPNCNQAAGRNIHVYSNAPFVQLLVNGQAFGAIQAMPPFASVNWSGVPYAAGSITAQGLASDGATVLTSHTKYSWGTATQLALTVDAPNPTTGTGSAVYLDGHDVALVRATVLDASGRVVENGGDVNVTFTVTAGPAYIHGVGSGDPACQEPSHAPWRTSYHGLARAVVRVLLDAAGSASDRAVRAMLNPDAGRSSNGQSASILQGDNSAAPTTMTITASAPGLVPASITIALSVNPADEVLAVATASVGAAYIGE